jgi:hypothetical protein
VADDNRLYQPEPGALPGNIIRETLYCVFLVRRVTCTMTAQIDGYNATPSREVSDLRREDPVVSGPSVDEQKRWILRHLWSRLKMREEYAVAARQK